MSGILTSVAYANPTWLSTDFETGESGVDHGWNEKKAWLRRGQQNEILGNVILAPIKLDGKNSKNRFSGANTDVTQSVIIGPMSAGRNTKQGMTILGYNAVGWESQATALGNNVYAGAQGTAVGSDVMAAGYASIAIGNDDILSQGGYADTLPQDLILKIYGYNENDGNKTTYKNILKKDEFLGKYGQKNGQDNRHYSPTYSAGIGAIAIGSRSVAYGDTSLALGTLSFALAKGSTAVGVRAFVSEEANGGVAIGDESRVFAANSFAIGNEAESTNKGALSYGSGAKAVGDGSIAIGTKVASNARIDERSAQQFRQKLMKELGIGTIVESEDNSGVNKIVKTEVKNLKTGDENKIVKAGFANHLADNVISNNISEVIKNLNLTYTEEEKEFLSTTTGDVKKSIKKKQKDGDHAITIGYYTANSGDNTVAIGTASYVKGKNSVVLGALNNVGKYASNTIAIGVGTNVHKENSIALGTGTTVTGAGAVAIGSGVGVTKDNTIALGYGAVGKSGESIVLGNDANLTEHASKSIIIGHSAQVENRNKEAKINEFHWADKIKYNNGEKELEMSAIAIGTGSKVYAEKGVAFGNNARINQSASNSIALGNEAEASMENSVALGNKSHTKYFYQQDKSNTATLTGMEAINLAPYTPEGSSYDLRTDKAAGIVSVGWTKNKSNSVEQELGLRRIVGVAPGALDSDVATIGQLKALAYVKKEGIVTYYTKVGDQIYKVVKGDDGKFYKANTANGTPFDKKVILKENVFAGPKGANEKIQTVGSGKDTKSFADMGDKIKFAHILDGEISQNSDEAITGTQLHQLGKDILGLKVKDNIKFETPTFEKVNYNGSSKTATTFKEAIDETIIAINKGFIFGDAENNATHQLGDSLIIKAGNMEIEEKALNKKDTFSSNNIRTSYLKEKKELLIGIKDEPTFKRVTVSEDINDSSSNMTLTTKKYVDGLLKTNPSSSNLHYLSVQGSKQDTNSNYNNDGAKANGAIAIGEGAQSKAQNAIVIGKDVSVDIPNSFVLGSNIAIETDSNRKRLNDAVVVMGIGTTLKNSFASTAIGAVYTSSGNHIKTGTPLKGAYIENAPWATVIGNKSKVYNGTDIIALANNIEVNVNKVNFDNDKNANDNLVIIGNRAKAARAKDSVVIGHEAKALNGNTNLHVYTAVNNAVAIGKGAIVDESNSVAIGSHSKTSGNIENNGYDIATNKASSTSDYIWKPTAGEFAIGDTNNSSKKTRRITGLAAGYDDTDAVNVAQLKYVDSLLKGKASNFKVIA
ncbi:hypothetical protein F1B92_01290, partial [Campylobacter sp. FMV-PI01]